MVVCKLDSHELMQRGYIAMLVVQQAYRGKGAGALPFAITPSQTRESAADVLLENERQTYFLVTNRVQRLGV